MDPLSITASIIAVIQITTVVSSHCMQYVRSAKNTKTLILSLVQELGGLQIVLNTLKQLTERDYSDLGGSDEESIDKNYLLPTLRKLCELEYVFEECLRKLVQLERDIAPTSQQSLSKKEAFLRALHWPIKEAYMKNILDEISQYISLFSLALTLDETNNVLDIRGKTIETNSIVKSLHAQREDELKQKHSDEIVKWLAAPDASVDYTHALRAKTQNTGTWLIEGKQYKAWKLHPGSLLWIYGTAGSGKTILSSTILEDLLGYSALNMNLAAIYFYFKADDIAKRTSAGMLRSLLKQLFERGNRSSEALTKLFEDVKLQPSTSQLLSALVSMISEFGCVYIVLDALDECQELGDLFDVLEEIDKAAGSSLHILLTSRDTKDIKEFVEGVTMNTGSIKLSASVVKQDIRTYIRDRLRTDRALKRWRNHSEVQQDIENSLIEKSDGMFQWVMCQLKELEDCRKPADLRRALASMPKGLNDTYAQMIGRISDDDYEVAMRMLYWLLFSVRPLHIEDLAELVAMDMNADPFEDIERLWDPSDVLNICPGLVTTVEESNDGIDGESRILVRLAHISIRDYLLSNDILNGKAARYHVEETVAHASITQCCLMYMRLIKTPLPDAGDDLPLALYAAENWLYHYERVSETASDTHLLALDFFLNRKNAFINWITYFSSITPPRFHPDLVESSTLTPLEVASAWGLLPLLKLMFDSHEIDTKSGNALQGALRAAYLSVSPPRENIKTLRLLLRHGADFNGDGKFTSTVHAASYFGFDDVVRSELDDGFDINTQGGEYGTALQAAVAGRHMRHFHDFMKIRISKDASQSIYDGISIKTVQLLLERGADPNICGGQNGSALLSSCVHGDLPCAKLLLDHGADPDYKITDRKRYKSCLSAASNCGNLSLVQLLIDRGAHINCPGALSAASSFGDISIIRFLLEKGADPRSTVHSADETALQRACANSQPEIVELLLQYGADPNVGGGYYESPLQCACAAYGSVEILKLLIAKGADVNKIEGPYGTSLHTAAFFGDVEMVEYLILQGADINIKGRMYPTALRHALQNGNTEVFTLLLKLGADMDTPGGRYGETLRESLAALPATKTDLWCQTSSSPSLCIIVRKGDSWHDFDNIVLDDRGSQYGADASGWDCILPDGVVLPIIGLMK